MWRRERLRHSVARIKNRKIRRPLQKGLLFYKTDCDEAVADGRDIWYTVGMNVYAISDLHLSGMCDKPMDIFGTGWEGYWERICADWRKKVAPDDIVLIAGDISWAMRLDQAMYDLHRIGDLPGYKVILRGNHDYWWESVSKLRARLPQGMYAVQNDCVRIDNYLICGSRLWAMPIRPSDEDVKMQGREYLRLEMSLRGAKAMRGEGDVVIAMCHYPPFDVTANANRYTDLFEKYGVSKVVYGHLHGKDCRVMHKRTIGRVEYYLTSCDLVGYELVHIDASSEA